jgi:hypothetical protein
LTSEVVALPVTLRDRIVILFELSLKINIVQQKTIIYCVLAAFCEGLDLLAAGPGPSQLFMDLLPIVVIGSVFGLLLARETARRPLVNAEVTHNV